MTRRVIVCAVAVAAALGSSNQVRRPRQDDAKAIGQRAARQLQGLPLAFEANVGQTAAAASFVARGQGYAVWATDGGPLLRLRRSTSSAATVSLRVVDGAPTEGPTPESPLPGRSNYFIGNDPSRWKTSVP